MVVRERSHWVTLATAVTSVTVHIVKFSLWGKAIKRMLVACPKPVDDPSKIFDFLCPPEGPHQKSSDQGVGSVIWVFASMGDPIAKSIAFHAKL